jgi:hypothetical protein
MDKIIIEALRAKRKDFSWQTNIAFFEQEVAIVLVN